MTARARTFGVVALAVIVSACRKQTAGEEVASRIKKTPPPSSSGDCHFDLRGGKDVTVFRTLGMLDEYLGRQVVEDSDTVEHFYASEPVVVAAFRGLTRKLASEQQIDPPAVEESAGHTYFRSRTLTERLNSCYAYTMAGGDLHEGPNGIMLRATEASLPLSLFLRSGTDTGDPAGGMSENVFYRRRALAYLSGAWRRYQRGPDYVFANSQKKAALVGHLLSDLGATHVTIESTVGLIPQTNIVHFTPTAQITGWFSQAW